MMNTDKQLDKMWDHVASHYINLKILMAGKAGVGKGSIVNALIGKEVSQVATTAAPCTQDNAEFLWASDIGDLRIVDVPGFGEAHAPVLNGLNRQENIRSLAKDAHLLLLVIKCDDKALEHEANFMRDWRTDSFLSTIPVIVIINQIDKMNPTRDWNPENMNLDKPSTPKEINIRNCVDYISKLPTFNELAHAGKIIPTSAGEYFGDATYGIETLRKRINDEIPEALRTILSREELSRQERSDMIIQSYSLAAGATAVQPVPLVDSFFIAPIQIAMMIHLGKVYDVHVTKSVAGGLVSAIGLSFVGNHIFLGIVGIIPGIKQFAGPAIAYGLTYSTGLIIRELFLTGNLSPTKQQVEALAMKYKSASREATERFKKQKNG